MHTEILKIMFELCSGNFFSCFDKHELLATIQNCFEKTTSKG